MSHVYIIYIYIYIYICNVYVQCMLVGTYRHIRGQEVSQLGRQAGRLAGMWVGRCYHSFRIVFEQERLQTSVVLAVAFSQYDHKGNGLPHPPQSLWTAQTHRKLIMLFRPARR